MEKRTISGELNEVYEGLMLLIHSSGKPATISHHMSALLGAGLVKIEKENTRIYYSADKEAIAGLLEFCEKTLL